VQTPAPPVIYGFRDDRRSTNPLQTLTSGRNVCAGITSTAAIARTATGAAASISSRAGSEGVYTKAGTYIHSSPWHIQLTGGTLSECAAGERKGGTFYFGNVPGLPPTILGKDTCRFFTPSRLFSSFHHYPSLQQACQRVKMPTDSTKNPKYTATDQLFLWTGSRRVD
jgi:hypothetical protein